MNFANNLVSWYKLNKRDLPWRNTKNPYFIWLSEIILQQTRVLNGTPYYIKFISTYPRIEDLAQASEDEVLKMWQGLGYYSRARNLHFTAKDITINFNGLFPKEYSQILKLKGVGVYTAAAISSFAYNSPYAVVDGNVIRVLSRVFGIRIPFDTTAGKNYFQKLAQELLIKSTPAVYNQAIMDFGATKCIPRSPNCITCPMNDICEAYNSSSVDELPLKSKKLKIRIRYLYFLIVESKGKIYIGKRKSGIWQGLYEFPNLEFAHRVDNNKLISSEIWQDFFKISKPNILDVSDEFIHELSHQKIYAKFYYVKSYIGQLKDYILVSKNKLRSYPVSRLMEKYLDTLDLR
tara:strand:- start:216 stop:1259 length:1044 start_codon:yes stop_codon:yes gene_type:complete